MLGETKKWLVHYSHNDGRCGDVRVTTKIVKHGGFEYGNGKAGILEVEEHRCGYDLRYCHDTDLHKVMLKDYFGSGLVEATEL